MKAARSLRPRGTTPQPEEPAKKAASKATKRKPQETEKTTSQDMSPTKKPKTYPGRKAKAAPVEDQPSSSTKNPVPAKTKAPASKTKAAASKRISLVVKKTKAPIRATRAVKNGTHSESDSELEEAVPQKETKNAPPAKTVKKTAKNKKIAVEEEKTEPSKSKPGRPAKATNSKKKAGEEKKPAAKKAAPKKATKKAPSKTANLSENESDKDEEVEEAKPMPKKGTKRTAKAANNVDEEDTGLKSEPKPKKATKKTAKSTKVTEENDLDKSDSDPQPSASKVTKKATKAKNIEEDESDDAEAQPSASKVTKKAKAQPAKKAKKPVSKKEPVGSSDEDAEKTDGKQVQNKTETEWDKLTFKPSSTSAFNLKVTTWNVGGLRSCIKKGGLGIFKHDNADIICFQETKCSEDQVPEECQQIEGYHKYWCSSNKQGYAGIALFSKTKPLDVQYGIGVEEHDDEGRCITAEYDNFYLVNAYVPNAGRKLVTLPKRLKWNEAFKSYINELDDKKPVILTGDMNVAHNEIDLANPKSNNKNAGFTKEEREGLTDFLADGYVDSFRHLYPDKTGAYTFWSYITKSRPKNVGWRLDYFIVSESLTKHICDNVILSEVYGSDHCPVTLYINVPDLDVKLKEVEPEIKPEVDKIVDTSVESEAALPVNTANGNGADLENDSEDVNTSQTDSTLDTTGDDSQ